MSSSARVERVPKIRKLGGFIQESSTLHSTVEWLHGPLSNKLQRIFVKVVHLSIFTAQLARSAAEFSGHLSIHSITAVKASLICFQKIFILSINSCFIRQALVESLEKTVTDLVGSLYNIFKLKLKFDLKKFVYCI